MAKGMCEKLAKEKGAVHLKCDSAGILANNQSRATKNAVTVCREFGVDIENHVSKNVSNIDKTDVDLFVVMTKQHGEAVKSIGVESKKIYVLDPEIIDPYGGDVNIYRKCRDQIETAIGILIDSLLVSGDLN